jgi:hypothetical protein
MLNVSDETLCWFLYGVKLIGPPFRLSFPHTEVGHVHSFSLSLSLSLSLSPHPPHPAPPVTLSLDHLRRRYEQVVRILISLLVFLIGNNIVVD